MYAATGRVRFHSGWMGDALCGVWQKMQTCCSPVARIVPGPVAERLCGLLTTDDCCALANAGMRINAKKMNRRHVMVAARPRARAETSGLYDCNRQPPKADP